jgi:hypothetical protein
MGFLTLLFIGTGTVNLTPSEFLLETGDALLLETGDVLLLES